METTVEEQNKEKKKNKKEKKLRTVSETSGTALNTLMFEL